jgi:hypothetical protein
MKTVALGLLLLFTAFGSSSKGAVAAEVDPALPATDLERILPGTEAPDLKLQSLNGTSVALSDYRNRKNIVLIFYRGYW